MIQPVWVKEFLSTLRHPGISILSPSPSSSLYQLEFSPNERVANNLPRLIRWRERQPFCLSIVVERFRSESPRTFSRFPGAPRCKQIAAASNIRAESWTISVIARAPLLAFSVNWTKFILPFSRTVPRKEVEDLMQIETPSEIRCLRCSNYGEQFNSLAHTCFATWIDKT